MRFVNKTILITGGAGGLGEAQARLFAAEGANVVIADRDEGRGKKLALAIGDQSLFVRLDVTQPADWEAAIARCVVEFDRLDVLVNGAGVSMGGTITEQPLEEYLVTLNVNLVGSWLGIKSAAPVLRSSQGGTIINISSAAAFVGAPGRSAYHSSKWGLRGLTRCAAQELADDGIRVLSIHPGPIATEMLLEREAELGRSAADGTLLRRNGEPEEVAKLVAFLVSDDAAYLTGSEVVIDGGMLAGRSA